MSSKINLSQEIKRLENKLDVNLSNQYKEKICKNIYNVVMNRIFTLGLNNNNSKIGKYAKSTKILRLKRGLQSTFVDLTFTGQLKSTYKLRINGNSYSIEFTSNYGRRISQYLEDHFRCNIFAIGDKDVTEATKMIKDFSKN